MGSPKDTEIRQARASDAEAVGIIYGPIVLRTSISFEEAVPTRAEIVRRMRSRPRLPWLVAEAEEGVVGFAYASQHRTRAAYRWSADCSVYLAETHRGQGLGRRLYERLLEVRDLGYVSLFAGIALPNPPSLALHERLGFRPVGVFSHVGFKQGAWLDVAW